MIGNLTVNVSAKDPTRKCETMRAFVNSPSNVRIVGVPSSLGKWKLTKVYFTVNYPDNQSVSKECTAGVGVYVATIPGSTLPGTSLLGYSVKADGTDETGAPVVGYVLGKGDVEIEDADGTVTTGATTHYVHVLPSCPSVPKEGDAYVDGGVWWFYNGTSWVTLGGTFAGNGWVQWPVSEGGDGKWHRVIISHGALAFEEIGVDEPECEPFALKSELEEHEGDTSNPHSVTKAQVGLGNVDNTRDADKPISSAMNRMLDTWMNPVIDGILEVGNFNTKAVTADTVNVATGVGDHRTVNSSTLYLTKEEANG